MPRYTQDPLERLITKIDLLSTGCWKWTGANGRGYGLIGHEDRLIPAHRLAYVLLIGDIPEGYHAHHDCGNVWCVNPTHLRPMPATEHYATRRHRNRDKTHCKRGHEFTPENTIIHGGARECRICGNARQLDRYYARTSRAVASCLPPGLSPTPPRRS